MLTIEEIREKVIPIAKKYGVKKFHCSGVMHAVKPMKKATWIFCLKEEKSSA